MIRDYQNCCRLCLSTDGMLFSIFNEDEMEKMIAPKILYCYSLFIYPQDPFSKFLCLRCFYQLDETWNFKQKCLRNSAFLNETLLKDSSVKHSDQFLSSVEAVIRSANMHTLLSCKTPEEVSIIYQRYEAFINFTCQVENVEVIDIASDEEDSKIATKTLISLRMECDRSSSEIDQNSRNFSLNLASRSSKSSRRSVSSEHSDDTYSSLSDRTFTSRTTAGSTHVDGNENVLLDTREKPFHHRLSRDRQYLGLENQTLGNERQSKTRNRKSISSHSSSPENKLPLNNSSSKNRSTSAEKLGLSLRGLRSLHQKTKENSRSEDLNSEGRSSPSSFCGIEGDFLPHGYDTTSEDIIRNAKDKTSGKTGKRRRFNGQLCNIDGSSESAYLSEDDEDDISLSELRPPSKRWRASLENLPSESNTEAVIAPISNLNQGKRYSCKYCRKTFKLKIDKKQHLKSCSEKKIINCKHCLKRMYREDELYVHNLCHLKLSIFKLKQNRYQCDQCNRYFYPKAILKKHKKSHCSVADSKWPQCSLGASENSTAFCDTEVDSSDNEMVEKYSTSSCNVSGTKTLIPDLDHSSRRDFRNRRQRNKLDLPLVEINFAKKQPIAQGLNMETNQEYVNNVCKYCYDTCKDATELWTHMQICHKYVNVSCPTMEDAVDNDSVYRCTDENCKKKFTSLKELILHSQTHVPLKCSYCNFSSFKFFTFLNHSANCPLSSQKAKYIRCCNKKFNKRYNFYVHKMFECQLNKTPLNVSCSSELNEKLKCGVCNKKVASSSEQLLLHLIHHSRSNFTSDSPHQEGGVSCDSDKAVFMRTFDLCPKAKDTSKEDRIISFDCAECKDSFLSLQAFQDHKKKCFILSCAKCKLTFSNNYDFIVHKCVARCKLCLTYLEGNQHFCSVRKILTTGPKNRFKCSICSIILPSLIAARKHIFKHFPSSSSEWKENVPCQICKEVCSNLLTLDIHHHQKHSSENAVSLSKLKVQVNLKDQTECNVTNSNQQPILSSESNISQESKVTIATSITESSMASDSGSTQINADLNSNLECTPVLK